ncbi:hypothetical protein HO912_10070 [Streptococcus suis]|nr:hypothetical protein [Streptococcus suis]
MHIIRYQLEEWIRVGFQNKEDYNNYLSLKEQYEDEALYYRFSIRELTNQLEIIITTRENAFPNLEPGLLEEYMSLVEKLETFQAGNYQYYLNLLV